MYGSLYRGDVPIYRLEKRFNLGGQAFVSSRGIPSSSSAVAKRAALKAFKESSRYFGAENRKIEKDKRVKRFHVATCEKRIRRKFLSTNSKEQTKALNFIPVDPELEVPDILVLQEQDGQVVDEYDRFLKTDGETREELFLHKTKQFNEQLSAEPSNVQLWFDFLKFQNQMILYGGSEISGDRRTSAATKVTERQKSILEKAKAQNPNEVLFFLSEIELLFKCGNQQSNAEQIDALCYSAITRFPTTLELWRIYLENRITHFTFVSITQARVEMSHILHTSIRTEQDKKNVSLMSASSSTQVYHPSSLLAKVAKEEINISYRKLMMLMHVTRFEQASGYQERAIAILQALFEFNCSCPAELYGREMQVGIQLFEQYWESEVPRVGEMSQSSGSSWNWWYNEFVLQKQNYKDANSAEILNHCMFQHVPEESSFLEFVDTTIFQPPDVFFPIPDRTSHEDGAEDENSISSSNNATAAGLNEQENHQATDSLQSVYSNVHGYRISMNNNSSATVAHEYERILNELRDGEVEEEKCDDTQTSEKTKSKERDVQSMYPEIINPGGDELYQWIRIEEGMEMMEWYPLRSSNAETISEAEMHPDRVIFFEEIQPFLCTIDPALKIELPFMLLRVLGIQFSSFASQSRMDTLVTKDNIFSADGTQFNPAMLHYQDEILGPLFQYFDFQKEGQQQASSSTDAAFLETTKPLSHHERAQKIRRRMHQRVFITTCQTLKDPNRISYIRNILTRGIATFSDSDRAMLQCCLIDFESAVAYEQLQSGIDGVEPDIRMNTRELVKQILASNQHELSLWYAYACLELQLGQVSAAVKICSTTLKFVSQLDPRHHHEIHALMYLWSHIRLSESDDTCVDRFETMYILASGVMVMNHDPTTTSSSSSIPPWNTLSKKKKSMSSSTWLQTLMQTLTPMTRLYILTRYEELLDLSWASLRSTQQQPTYDNHRHLAFLSLLFNCIIFQYLAQDPEEPGHDVALRAIRTTYTKWISTVSSVVVTQSSSKSLRYPYLVEKMYLHQLEWMDRHASRTTTRGTWPVKADIRDTLLRALNHFPAHGLFLRSLVDLERSSSGNQIIRRFFQQRGNSSLSCIEWSARVLSEVLRSQRSSAIASHRLRHVFEDCLVDVQMQRHVLIWRMYIRCLVKHRQYLEAKKVFFRAIHHCPWSKELYLDSVRVLRPMFGRGEEIRELFHLALERDVYLRHELEEPGATTSPFVPVTVAVSDPFQHEM